MPHYLTIGYKSDVPWILLDHQSKRSAHNELVKSLGVENPEGLESVEIWSKNRGRIRVKNLTESLLNTPEKQVDFVNFDSEIDSELSNNSQSSDPEGSDIADGAGDLANVASSPAGDTTHTPAVQPSEPAASSGSEAGQLEGMNSTYLPPMIGSDAYPEDSVSIPVSRLDEGESSEGQPDLMETPPQKGKKK